MARSIGRLAASAVHASANPCSESLFAHVYLTRAYGTRRPPDAQADGCGRGPLDFENQRREGRCMDVVTKTKPPRRGLLAATVVLALALLAITAAAQQEFSAEMIGRIAVQSEDDRPVPQQLDLKWWWPCSSRPAWRTRAALRRPRDPWPCRKASTPPAPATTLASASSPLCRTRRASRCCACHALQGAELRAR